MADVPARPGAWPGAARVEMPPVRGFWSLTLYNEHHFCHPDELNRYSFGPKNKNLHRAGDGSLTLTSAATPPADQELRAKGPTCAGAWCWWWPVRPPW